MSSAIMLPHELQSLLGLRRPQSILIRGAPGSGKTTLALALLEGFSGRRFFATFRVSKDDLYEQFPWLGSSDGNSVGVMDLATEGGTTDGTARSSPDGPSPPGEPPLPGPLREIWATSSPQRPTILAIDSWEAFVEANSVPGERSASDATLRGRAILSRLTHGPATTVLISEHEGPTPLDYLVNSVLDLRTESFDDRAERWLYLTKIRGVRILNRGYPFTLEGSRFTCVTPVHAELRARLPRGEPAPDPQPGHLWPGSAQFAAHFGELPLNRIMIWEADEGVPLETIRLLFAPIVFQVVRDGGRIFHLLPFGLPPDDVWSFYSSVVPIEDFARQVRIQTSVYPRPDSGVPESVIAPMRSASGAAGPRNPAAHRFIREGGKPGAPNLMVIWTAGLHPQEPGDPPPYTPDNLPAIATAYFGAAPVHEIFIGSPGDPFLGSLRPMAAIRIRLRARRGRVFLYGESPMTPPLLLVVEGDGYRLLPMV